MKTITITEEKYAEAAGTAMQDFVGSIDDDNEKLLKGMMFLVIQGMIYHELFNEEEETYDA